MSFSFIYANPSPPQVVSEVWFAENGHFMMELSSSSPSSYPVFDMSDIYLNTHNWLSHIPLSGSIVFGGGVVVDITALIPEMVFNPEDDTLEIYYYSSGQLYFSNSIQWGEDFNTHNINAPNPGQSLVFCHTFNGYEVFKEEPPTPGSHPYTALARDTLRVIVTDQYGNPISGAPVFLSINMRPWVPNSYRVTDADGVLADTLYAGKCLVRVKHPQTNTIIFEQTYWLEPNQTTTIPIQISMTGVNDNTAPALSATELKAYPSPFNLSKHEMITFQYDSKTKLLSKSYIKIYDAKGRFVCQIPMSDKVTASWKPDKDISSGMYFARLISGNRIVDTTTFIVIK